MIPGVIYLVSWPLQLLIRLLTESTLSSYVLYYRLPLLILVCVLTVFAITKLKAERRWRAMFIIWLFSYLVSTLCVCSQVGTYATTFTEPVLGIAVGLGYLVPTLADAAGGVRRDPLQYAGVAGRVVNAGVMGIYLLRALLLH